MPIDTKITDEVWRRYCWLRDNGHSHFIAKAQKCERFFAGVQWSEDDLNTLKQVKRPALTINKILSTVSNVLGEQIFNRTDIAFRPRSSAATGEVATALSKVFSQIADNNQLNWVRSDVFCDGLLSSRGFFDVRIAYEDSLQGEVRVTQLNPKDVMIDSDADSYDPDQWGDVIITRWLTLEEIELDYGKANAEILHGRSGTGGAYEFDESTVERDRFGTDASVAVREIYVEDRLQRRIRVIERQHRKLGSVRHIANIRTGDIRPVPAEWSEERLAAHLATSPELTTLKRAAKRIRWTVVADNVVLHDTWSPYSHFTVVPYFPHFLRGTTIGLVENLVGPQEMLNKVSSQQLHVVNTTANSGWIFKTGTLMNMSVAELEERGAQTGPVIETKNGPEDIDKIQPNQVPTGLDRLAANAEEHIKGISGVSDYMLGSAREDVAAKSVNTNKMSGQANLARMMDNLNRTDHLLARRILCLIQSYYTEPRLLHITIDRLTNKTEQFEINQVTPEGQIINDLTIGEYAVVATTQPERDTYEDSQFDHALDLKLKAGVSIPDRFIIQASRLQNKAEVIQAMEGDSTSPEAQAAAALQQRTAEAQVASIEADTEAKRADAQLKLSKAQAEGAPTPGQASLEQQKVEMDHQLAVQAAEREHSIALQKLELEKERMTQELQLKREEMNMKREAAQEAAMAQRVAAVEAARNPSPPLSNA